MEIIKNKTDITSLENNKCIGELEICDNSCIRFFGENNILFFEDGVKIKDSFINFYGSNSLVYIGKSNSNISVDISIYNNSVFHIGRDVYINAAGSPLKAILSERKHVFIGNDCMFSYNVSIRTADPHLIYDSKTKARLNLSQSVFIGDHVWIAQDVLLLKGTQVDSGVIIGARSVLSNKKIETNSSWGGNPCRRIKSDVFWDGSCVHGWALNQTEASMNYSSLMDFYHISNENLERWIYSKDEKSIGFDEIDRNLDALTTSEDKLNYILDLNNNFFKNRFAHE